MLLLAWMWFSPEVQVLYSHFSFLSCHSNSGAMRTVVIGDSMVRRVAARKVQLAGGGFTMYFGEGGAKIGGLREMTIRNLSRRRMPTTLIIHIGTNDIFLDSIGAIRYRIEENVMSVRKLLPHKRIIWSNILPHAIYLKKNQESKGAGKRCTLNLNKFAHNLCMKIPNMRYIQHQNFSFTDRSLFYWDSVHLSDKGYKLLLANWSNGLVFLNAHSDALGYSPCP